MGSQSKAQVSRNRDRISELPDSVLSHMLSFLATKYAVRTSALSARWKNIWTLVPIVDFELEYSWSSKYESEHANFLSFVDRVLLYRGSSDIQRFRLHCHINPEDFSRVDGWICTAIRRNVVELDVHVRLRRGEGLMFEFPKSVFWCKTLVALKLSSDCLSYALPKSGCFPNLKFLYVEVDYPDDDSMGRLFSCGPLVEDLTVKATPTSCATRDFKLSVPSLKILTIMTGLDVIGDPCKYYFFIDAPKLESLELDMNIIPSFTFQNSTSLEKAVINIKEHWGCVEDDFCDHATALFAAISNVEYLSLSAHFLYACCLPAFDNLVQLKLVIHNCYRWILLAQLLKRSPNLECLILEYELEDDIGFYYSPDEENSGDEENSEDKENSDAEENLEDEVSSDDEANSKDDANSEDGKNSGEEDSDEEYSKFYRWTAKHHWWNRNKSAPTCLLSHLKTVSISGFKGRKDERELVKYLLKNGEVLRKMTIYMDDFMHSKDGFYKESIYMDGFMHSKEEFYKESALFRRASRKCRVEFI